MLDTLSEQIYVFSVVLVVILKKQTGSGGAVGAGERGRLCL